jgi:hypothetical protein
MVEGKRLTGTEGHFLWQATQNTLEDFEVYGSTR